MKQYQVQGGDTLSLIAQRELGDALKWPAIYETNKRAMDMAYARARPTLDRIFAHRHGIKSASDLVTAGQVLIIP